MKCLLKILLILLIQGILVQTVSAQLVCNQAFIDSVKQSVIDSIASKEKEKISEEYKIAKEWYERIKEKFEQEEKTSKGTDIYWVSNGDEASEILFKKLSAVGLKTGQCTGKGLKISTLKTLCTSTILGTVRCSYLPQLTITYCNDTHIDKLIFERTFNSHGREENDAKQKVRNSLQNADFSAWVNILQTMK